MFGISLPEMLVIAVVAVIVLGPEKLPGAMVEIAKFFKFFRQTINSAKSSFDQELKIAELKEDAQKYKENLQEMTSGVRKKLTFEELDELKKGVNEAKNSVRESFESIKNELKNPLETLNNGEILSDDKIFNKNTENGENLKNAEILNQNENLNNKNSPKTTPQNLNQKNSEILENKSTQTHENLAKKAQNV